MTKNIRWYDKDKYLRAFMAIMETLPQEVQIEIANDMILNMPKIIGDNYDKFVNNMSCKNPRVYRRWYDIDPALHSAIEAMQILSAEQRSDLINLISDIIIMYTNRDYTEMVDLITKKAESEEQNG